MQTLIRRGVGDGAAGLGLPFLHMSEGPFSHDAGHLSSTCSMCKLSQSTLMLLKLAVDRHNALLYILRSPETTRWSTKQLLILLLKSVGKIIC